MGCSCCVSSECDGDKVTRIELADSIFFTVNILCHDVTIMIDVGVLFTVSVLEDKDGFLWVVVQVTQVCNTLALAWVELKLGHVSSFHLSCEVLEDTGVLGMFCIDCQASSMNGSNTQLAFNAEATGQDLATTNKTLLAKEVEAEPAGAIVKRLGCEDDKH
jgi:hypothetical protein